MIKIKLHFYQPLYLEMEKKKYPYNPKLLRSLKRDIYEMATTAKEVDSFKLVDIDDDDIEYAVAGVTVTNKQAQRVQDRFTTTDDVYKDIVFDDLEFDVDVLVFKALPTLVNGSNKCFPVHKYLNMLSPEKRAKVDPKVLDCAKTTLDDFFNTAIKKRRSTTPIEDFEELKKISEKDILPVHIQITKFAFLKNFENEKELLETFLKGVLTDHPDFFSNPTFKNDRSELRRLIKILDFMKHYEQ